MALPGPHQRYARTSQAVGTEIGGELILLHTGNWHYFQFDRVGAAIWGLLETPRDLDSLVASLTERFQVDPQQCARETGAFLTEAQKSGLVLLQD